MAWLDRVPWTPLVVAAILLGPAPLTPQPHLVEKLELAARGGLTRPLDIFDLFLHGAGPVLLLLKAARRWWVRA